MPDENALNIVEVPQTAVMKVEPKIPDVSLDPMDFQQEIQKIAAEKGVVIMADGSVEPKDAPKEEVKEPEPQADPQPEIAQAESQPEAEVVVPEKFKDESGKADVEKVVKSTLSAEAALKKYVELEKELRKKQSEVHKLKTTAPEVQAQPQGNDLESLIAADLQANQQNPAKVLAKWAYAIEQSAAQKAEQAKLEALRDIEQFRQENAYRNMQEELREIAKNDSWVLSEEGVNTLAKIRDEIPHINNLPNPWSEAYKQHCAKQYMLERSNRQGNISTPKKMTAPAVPVNSANRSSTPKVFRNERELNSYLDTLDPKQVKAFWDKNLAGM